MDTLSAHLASMRGGAADLGPADHVEKFFKRNKVYGPVFRSTVKVYGKDVTYPLPARFMTILTKLAAMVKMDYGGAPVLKAGYFIPQPAAVKTHNYGAQTHLVLLDATQHTKPSMLFVCGAQVCVFACVRACLVCVRDGGGEGERSRERERMGRERGRLGRGKGGEGGGAFVQP